MQVTTIAPAADSRATARKLPAALEFPSHDVVVLRSERNQDRTESALLFVPDNARAFFRERIQSYGRDPGNRRRPDVDRFEAIETIVSAEIRSLFTGNVDFLNPDRAWWEFWFREPTVMLDRMRAVALAANLDVHEDRLVFPDTTVLFVHGAAEDVAAFAARIPGAVTEVRRATGTIETFLGGGGAGQNEWVADLAERVMRPAEGSPVVCSLDTGVAAGHPLIAVGLSGAWAYDEAWGVDDHHPNGGHGTAMTGLVLYGDLERHLNGVQPVALTHTAESMKLLPPHGFPPTKPPSYGVVTQGAVALVELQQPGVSRSFCLAATATDFPPDRPSTWSGALDQVAAGSMPGENDGTPAARRPKRLLMVATGNVSGGMAADVSPSQPIEDPAQSWNVLTIGGFTRKEQVPQPPPQLKAVVPANHRSPFSRGSQTLPADLTPIKPEVLFEAGNMLSDDIGYCAWAPSVSLLAPSSDTENEPLVPFWATSAAVGVAGNFVGGLSAALPGCWPETIRALTVDSAQWPQPIRNRFVGTGAHWKTGTKAKRQKLLREFGYGVPDLQRAALSALNDVSLVAEAEIQPYDVGADGRSAVFNEMHFYDLPWPTEALREIENGIVTMKVTLSYFVEPNLTGKAATRPDTYRSFGLRFAMKNRGETSARFRNRISASQGNDGTEADGEASYWLLGPKAVQAGSLHCDLWRGRAIELAAHDEIAIYPVGGWWKSHVGQRRVTDRARYSLVISISAPSHEVDLYSEIEALVELQEIQMVV